MEFDIVEDSFAQNKLFIWYEGLCLGNIIEDYNESPKEKYIAVAYPDSFCGSHPSKAAAAFAVYQKHQSNRPDGTFERVRAL